MSGFTGVPTVPLVVRDMDTPTPFSTLLLPDPLGYNETITVSLYSSYYGYYYTSPPSASGTLSDPAGGGTFDTATNTFTATATVVGTPTPASLILDRLVYTPPKLGNGLAQSVATFINVTSRNSTTGQTVTRPTVTETLQIVTPPAITGTVSNQPVAAGEKINPFGPAQVSDGNYGAVSTLNETITITDGGVATDADGLLTGTGLSKTGMGTYAIAGYNSDRLSSLVFTTTQATGTHAAVFTLAAGDTATGYTTTDNKTSVEIIGTVPGGPPGTTVLGGGGVNYSAPAGETVVTGSGNDTVTATAGLVTVVGSAGNLVFIGGIGASSVTGGAGSSTVLGGSGGGYYTGGRTGFNVLVSQGASGANTTLTGAGAGDQIFGSAAGNDLLIAGSGRDSMLGGSGNTTIQGGAASSVVFTGGGSSLVNGGIAGSDTIVGGVGSLKVNAQGGDAIFGGSGALNVTGSKSGADSVVGGAGPLIVNGQGANMLVVAGTATSNIQVGNGASLIFAGTGGSSVTGGAGSLQVVLGAGATTVRQGSGPAVYDVVKGAAGGTDVISGFRPGTDQVHLFGYLPSEQQVTSSGGSSLIGLADGTKIQIVGVTNLGSSIVG